MRTRSTGSRIVATFACCLAVLVLGAPAIAHERHVEPADSVADSSSRASAGFPAAQPVRAAARRAFEMPPLREAVASHLHNKLVHFPIVLALLSAGLLVTVRRRRNLEAAARWTSWLVAAAGGAAYFTGRAQAQAFDGEPKEWLVALHGQVGTAAAAALLVAAIAGSWSGTARHAWILGLLAAGLVLAAGFYGGLVAHG